MASRYLQFYTQPRVFRIANKEGFPEFVEFYVRLDEQGTRQMVVNRLDEQGVPKFPEPQVSRAKGLPDVRAVSGSNLPFARAQKTATALDLQSRGSITNLSLLKAINWPTPEEEDQKVQEQQAKLAQQEAQGAV